MSDMQLQNESAAEYTTRLISGNAYRKGIFGAFELLNSLHSDRYKAKSPESRLDLDRIALHAIKSLTISVLFASVAMAIWLIQLLFLTQGRDGIFIFFLLNLVGALLTAYELFYLRWAIARRFLKKFYDPNFQPELPLYQEFLRPLVAFFKRHILEPEPNQNIITFGRYQPFLGAGGQISQWTQAIDRKPAENQPDGTARINIPVQEFYEAVDQELKTLDLPNLEILSRLFVDGFEMNVDGKLLPSLKASPETILPEEDAWSLGQGSLGNEYRLYRLYKYTDTDRDQVLSYFLRFYNLGSITFVEVSAHILPCIDRQRFSLTPVLKDSKTSRFLKMLGIAFLLLFIPLPGGYIVISLVHLVIFAQNIIAWWLNDSKQSRAANWQEEYNHGLIRTFRESIAARNYESYYGVQDLTMYWKSIQQAVLDGIVKLLKQYEVDTSQFEQVANNIVNNGVMVSGGNFSENQFAVGSRASATSNKNSIVQQAKATARRVMSSPNN